MRCSVSPSRRGGRRGVGGRRLRRGGAFRAARRVNRFI